MEMFRKKLPQDPAVSDKEGLALFLLNLLLGAVSEKYSGGKIMMERFLDELPAPLQTQDSELAVLPRFIG